MDHKFDQYAAGIIQHFKMKRKGPKEHGDVPCPNCGGEDRFWINDRNGQLKHHCRKDCAFIDRDNKLQDMGLLPKWEPDSQLNPTSSTPYNVRRNIPLKGAKLQGADVIVSLVDVGTMKEVGTQTIKPDGRKLFTKGLKKEGAGAFIGEASDTLFVTEGWADAVVVHEATGHQVCFALDASNLPKTVALLGHKNIIIAADNDAKGIAAAEATGKPWVAPESHGEDWWDVFHQKGNEGVKRALERPPLEKKPSDPFAGYAISTGVELFEKTFKEQKWLKKGFIPTPNLTLIAGAPKAGKSWYALGLTDELTAAGHTVVYIANEDTERRLKARYDKVAGFPNENAIFLSGLSSDKPLPKGKQAHYFIRSLKSRYKDLACVVVDTVQAIREPNLKQNDYAVVEAEFASLRKLAHELMISIIVVHHTKKTNGDFENSKIDQILGSQAVAATVETIIILQQVRGSQDVNLFITGKDVEQKDEYRMHWTEKGFSDPEDKRLADRGPFQKSIIEYVKHHPRCTQAAIGEALDRKKQQVNEAVSTLIESGILKRVEGQRLICVLT